MQGAVKSKGWLGALALSSAMSFCAAQGVATPSDPMDAQVQADVTKALDKKQFSAVQATVSGGTVTLTGVVPTYADKEDADRRTHHRKNVKAVSNQIQVAVGEIPDEVLQRKLVEKVSTDRVGYGTTAFNSITVQVQNGVVTLGGVAYGPVDKDTAVSDVANTVGVRDVVDNIEVAPLSGNDDRIRAQEFRAIYSFPTLSKYAIDPAKPIRITVVNGKVTLTGVVDTKEESEAANIRANTVPGVFKVTNELQVSGRGGGK